MKATAISALLALMLAIAQVQADVRINQIQFVGSHNSYKQAMSPLVFRALHLLDAKAAESLEYWHEPIATQLDLGLRKLEIDIFWDVYPSCKRRGRVERQRRPSSSHLSRPLDQQSCSGNT